MHDRVRREGHLPRFEHERRSQDLRVGVRGVRDPDRPQRLAHTVRHAWTDLTFLSELYQLLDWGGRFFVSPVVFYRRTQLPLFVDERRVADYTVDQPGI